MEKPILELKGILNDAALDSLTPRQEKVMRFYYGFGRQKASVKDIAENFSIPQHHVWEILAKAHRLLNHPKRLKLMATA